MIKLMLTGIGIGISYFGILWLIGIFLHGFGEGTGIFMYSTISPFGFLENTPLKIIGLISFIIFWPIIFSLAITGNWRIFTILLILIHYFGLVSICLDYIRTSLSQIINVWDSSPIAFILWIVIYLAGQIFLWYKILSPGIKNLFKIG